jgi:hypothetical protein
MPKPKRPRDANQLAKMIVDLATGGIDEEAPELSIKQRAGQLGGLKGGEARAKALSRKRRSEIAKKAADTRWNKDKAGQ